jgi:hypothetical protein
MFFVFFADCSRFPLIQVIAVTELNNLIARAKRTHIAELPTLRKPLLLNTELDLRVVLTWDADAVDVDLIVIEPSGERCSAFNNYSKSGGLMSEDFSGGYGPLEYSLRHASVGTYSIQAVLFSGTVFEPVLVACRIYTAYGTPRETCVVNVVLLQKPKQLVSIGEVLFRASN